jgi:hypothetical protein
LGTTTTSQNLPLDTAYYGNSDARVVATGFEVHNTTNPLNVSGTCTVWRLPQTTEKATRIANLTVDRGVTACISTAQPLQSLPNPPNTISTATNLPGSMTWKAAQGAYVIPVMTDEENHPDSLVEAYPIQIDDIPTLYAPTITTTGAAKLQTSNVVMLETPFSMGGAFFTGLSPTSTLTVNAVWIVERFPKPTNVDLTTLARPSNPYDFKAIRMYSEMTRNMSPGVVVSANSMGDWFASLAKIAMQAAPVVAGIITGSGSLGGLLTTSRNSDPMLALTQPSKYKPGAEQTALGYLGSKVMEIGSNWINSPKETQIVKREEIKTVLPEHRTTQIVSQPTYRQPLVFVENSATRRKLSAMNRANALSQAGNRGSNVWSPEERKLRKIKQTKKR